MDATIFLPQSYLNKMVRFFFRLLFFTIVTFFLSSCRKSDYTKLVERELKKGVRSDSILLGISFGDTKTDFYAKCAELNKQHLTMQGTMGFSVQYLFEDSIYHKNPTPIKLLFFPYFDENDKLIDMDLKFSYLGWAPWTRDLQADSMKIRLKRILMDWYKGNDFIKAHVGKDTLDVKLDGNRRIVLKVEDAQTVSARAQDLFSPKYKPKGF